MGSGVSKDDEVVNDADYARHVKSEATFSSGQKSKGEISQGHRGQTSHKQIAHSRSERTASVVSRVEGYEAKVIQITKDGFSSTDVTVMEGQVVTFVWDETCSPVMSIFQVVYDGETLKPVVGGFGGSPTDHNREYEQLFSLEGEYKFVINKIRCTPFTVNVTARSELDADVTDNGFIPDIIHIDQGHRICWSWKSCDSPHTVNELTYVMDKGCFSRQQNKNQNVVATVTGKHKQQFKTPGTYYFRTESSQLGRYHLCIVHVRSIAREHRVEVLDRTFSPMILLIEEGDRVWWRWDKTKCQKLHHIYQIEAPGDDHKEDSPYEPTVNGFRWHQNPSNQGLMCHQFRQPGVYYYSDQNYDEAAYYIGTIIVKPRPKEHKVEVKGKVFSPDVLYAQTGDRVLWKWDGEAAFRAGDNLLILEEDKVVNPDPETSSTSAEDEKLLQTVDEDAARLMAKSGRATTSLANIGLYTYRVCDASDDASSCSVVVNPGPRNHTVHVTDAGLEPKVVKIRPNDRVWWVWQSGKKQHNVKQVSHEGARIPSGFSSGLARDSPSAFHYQFKSPGVFYFESNGLPKVYGAILVSTEPQVHIVTVGKEIQPNPVTVQLRDIICWVFKQSVRHGVVEVPSVDKLLDATFAEVPVSSRHCIAQAIKKLGLTHFYSKSFQKGKKQTNVMDEIKLSSAVCDERSDFAVIRVTKQRGFHPPEIFLEKGKTVMWTWRGSSEQHNIFHVTDPKSDAPLNPITGPKAFNSGKALENNSFVHTFDEPGDYPVASQGAPGYSCVVHIRDRDEIVQTAEPYNISEKKGGTVDRHYRVDLDCKTEGAEIYYTTDGSLPGLHHYETKHYKKHKGILLKDPGLCFVRAIATKPEQVYSHVFTSRCYWVLSGDKDKDDSMDEASSSLPVEDKQQGLSSWDWWSCRPHIKACFTGPGSVNIFWDLPESESARDQIKGYQVFLNGVSYCSMFPLHNNSLNVQGLAGGRNYKIVVRVYPKDSQNVEIESNSLNLQCPVETESGGPLISLVKSDKPDSLTIVWMSVDNPDTPVDSYVIYLNDQQCGPKLVPHPESKRCKVVVSSCELNTTYKIHVQALLKDSKETRISNILEVFLPLDTSQFKYPSAEKMEDEEDLYKEYIQIAEGSGYLSAMDDPDNPIWETETDSSSGVSEEDGPKKKRRRKKKTNVLGIQPDGSLDKAQRGHSEYAQPDNAGDAQGGSEHGTFIPIIASLDSNNSSQESSSDKNNKESDKQTIYYDASKDGLVNSEENKMLRKSGLGDLGDSQDESERRIAGPVVIEVEKAKVMDSSDLPVGEVSKQDVSMEKTTMIQVGEGEYVSVDKDGLLSSPSVMAQSEGTDAMRVAWKMDHLKDSEYQLQLFVVNVVGAKFSSDISSDISFECKMVEKGKQVQGVQHCWNVQCDPERFQHECQVKGLLPEVTYRVYVVANYVMMKGNKPCEAQTSSTVLYYTIQGPPASPQLWIAKVDLYSACVQWAVPALGRGQKLKGYLIFSNGKQLGGICSPDVREMVIENLIPGKTLSVFLKAVSEFAEQESLPSRSVHITCPRRPPAPVITQEPSFKQGCVLIAWNKPQGQTYSSNREAISHYSIYVDDKWHGEIRTNKMSDQQGYQFYLTDLLSEQGYDISVKAVAGDRNLDQNVQHVYCLSESPESNIVPVMAPAAPRSPKLRLEGLHPDGIDVTWQVPQQCGDAVISGYQMLRNGKLYGSVIPPDVTSLHIRDVTLGEKIELQVIALTEHAVGKADRKTDIDKDSGKGSSQQEDKENSPSHKTQPASTCLIEFKGMENSVDYSAWPTLLKDVFAGDRYTGCKPGPKLIVHYTGLVCAPSEVWCEKVTGHSALIVWEKASDFKAHFVLPDSYQVTWWPGDRPQENIQSDSTTDDHLLIVGLRPSTAYTVVVEARKIEKYKDYDEGTSVAETPDGLNAFILSSKSKQLSVKTASPADPPSNVGIIAMTCHSLKVGWDPPREHGSEIIGIRVECISLDSQNEHHVAVDTLPDSTTAEISGLHEKTDYCVKVIAVMEEYFTHLPDKHHHKQYQGFPQDVLASKEESPWLPSSSILTKTSGTEPPSNIKVIKATTTSLTLCWTPPLVYGSNKLTGQIIRWSNVKKAHISGLEELQIASHVSVLPTEDTLTIGDLSPGVQYVVVIEAVVSVKTTLEPDSWDGSNIERYRRTTHVMSTPFYVRTRAPIEPPKVLVTSYTQNSAILYWEKPPLMAMVGKDEDNNPRYLRRYLQGYKLEINGKLQSCMGPDVNSCTLTRCKPGRTYSVVLVAMTCTEEGKKARKQKLKSYLTTVEGQEPDYMTLLQDDEYLDESPSEPVEISLPKDQDGYLKTLEARYQHPAEGDHTFGDIELTWTVQGKSNLLKQFNIVWYCVDDRVIQTKYVGPEERKATLAVTRNKTIYVIKVEPAYYTEILPQHSQEVQVLVPGPPDPPEIFLKSVDVDEFCVEWGEPKLYGGVKVKGYQVYLNDKKAGNELAATQNKATIPCRPNRTYRVNVVALSDQPLHGNSHKSNTLVVSPSGHAAASMLLDDPPSEDSGIPVKVTKVTESSINMDWSRFVETADVAFYKIQWSSVAQPEQREVKLSEKDFTCVINKCLPGTTHFVRLVAYSASGQILEQSRQLTIQTSAPPDAPRLSVRACNFRYIAVQWEKPTTYGDALVTGYKVFVNGVVEATMGTDHLSYTYTQGKPCQEYAFQVQALTADNHMSSKPSEPLVIMWPGSKAPAIKHLPSISSSTLRVGWDDPYLTEGLKIKHFLLCCKEESTEKMVQTIGPLHADAREGEFKNLKEGTYLVYLEVYVYGSDSVIRSEVMSMQPALSPQPPQITVTLVGLEDRRQVEKFTCDLVNKRDRLIRQVGHKLRKIGALTHPLRAEKNEDVVNGAVYLSHIEELLEKCFSVLENYTGELTALVSWQCPQSHPDIQVSGYRLLLDGKQYGNPMHAGVKTIRVQLGLEQPSYRLSMVATSDKPQGVSGESNSVDVLTMPFKPFTFYCYHKIHRKDTKYPAYGCCKYEDSIQYERQSAKKLANQGLLQKPIPPPVCSLLDIFDGEFKPLMSNHSARCPTAIFFWTPWCLSSQKMMDHYIRFAKDNAKEMTYIAVACGLSGAAAESKKTLAHTITANSWREDRVVWHATSDCASNIYESMNNSSRTITGLKVGQDKVKEKLMDLTEVLGIAGVPTLLFMSPEGHIAWHGRYCAFDYPGFESFMRHVVSEVLKQPCPVLNCDSCKNDTTVNEDAIGHLLRGIASSNNAHTTSKSLVPYIWSPRHTKHASMNGSTSNLAKTHRPGSPRRRVHNCITVNQRPYSASSVTGMLDKSPYSICVAPHLHRPHKIKPRSLSAKVPYYPHKDAELS